jgi:hypothetical protein
MSELISEKAIEKATGQSWSVWLERLEEMGARELSHKEIATKLVADYAVPGWWAQSLTVRFEQVIGRRQSGQANDGSFSISVSRTIAGSLNEAMLWWLKKVQSRTDFNGVTIISSSTTETEKWRNYRVALKDGSRVVVGIYAKSPTKAGLGLQHDKLASAEAGEMWRYYWKTLLLEGEDHPLSDS